MRFSRKPFFRWSLRLGGVGLVGWCLGMFVVPWFFPLPDGITDPEAFAPGTTYTDRDGTPLRRLLAEDDLRIDSAAAYEELPTQLVEATLAAEDKRFFTHGGIDFLGLARAARDAVRHREFVSGASTVTQQLVKISTPSGPRNFPAKFREMFTARRLEMSWDKEQILVAYLNRLPYGNQLTGCRAAARGYFGKPLGDLSLAECAFLAGLPNKPTRLNPYRNFEGARERQQWILERMREEGWITESDYRAALGETLRLSETGPIGEFEAPHFIELVRAAEDLTGRIETETTLDLGLQRFVEQTVETRLQLVDQEIDQAITTQAAVVVIENETAEVRALIGSRDFFVSESGQVNGAWTPRSPGSSLKPFTYLLALERGQSAGSILPDVPTEYATGTGVYRPVNYDRRFRGPVTVRRALANSLNVPAVRMLDEIGGAEILHGAMIGRLGFTGLDPDARTYGLGLTLGTAEVRLLELTNAYAGLARMGDVRPYRLTRGGAPTEEGEASESTPFDPEACWIIADILSDNLARAEAFGLNSPLRLPFRVAAKTGTSTDYRDNWTVGFTPEFTVGVWVGHFGNASLPKMSGVNGAGPIFQAVMTEVHRDVTPSWYPRPATLVEAEIDAFHGKRLSESTQAIARHTLREVFRSGSLPKPAAARDYDARGRSQVEADYRRWLATTGRHFEDRLAVEEGAPSRTEPLRILSPVSGTVAYLDPDLPGGGRRFPLKIDGRDDQATRVKWHSDTLQIESDPDSGRAWLLLEPGRHEVVVVDPATGTQSISGIEVQSL